MMVRQRVYALALGHEDPDDHDELRPDPALQKAAGADGPLAGAPTLCRLEQGMAGKTRFACTGRWWNGLSLPSRNMCRKSL